MSEKQKLIKLIKQVIAEDFKGFPNDAAEVESDNLTATLSEYDDSEGNYPTATVQVYTGGGREGTRLMLYKGNARTRDNVTSDVSYKTPTQFKSIVGYVKDLKAKEAAGQKISLDRYMTTDRDVISVLLNLDDSELNTLANEKVVVTTNIPNEILDLTGKHIKDEPTNDDEAGRGPEYRVRSDEPEPFGYGMNEGKKITLKEFSNIIFESIQEVMTEKSWISEIQMQSLEDFYQDEMDDVVAESLLDVREEVDLDKYRDMLGASFKELSDDELMAYLRRQYLKRQATTDKDLKKQLAKDPEFQRQIKIDKYKYPYIHASTAVKIVDASGKEFNLEQLKNSIKERPSKILKQNEKIQHSGGGVSIYYNIGLPALKGLAVNEKTNKLVVIDTCPGAGACKVYCYAKKGGYIQYENAPLSATRMLNFLVNDPSGFKSMLEREIAAAVKSAGKKNAKVVIRWHDAGDMFSSDYLNLAYDVARKFPNVDFYAYTKMAGVAQGEKPSNFIMNFSAGATKPQERDVDFSKTKHSTVVPKQMFDDLITKDDKGVAIRDDQDRIQFSPENLARLKQKLAAKYNVPASSILSYEEMLATPESSEVGKYNVIVRPGDGDESANRKDVKGTYLLIH
jgi:hypothetical protein